MKGSLAIRIAGWSVAVAVLLLPVVGLLDGWFAVGRWPVKTLRVDGAFTHVSSAEVRAVVTPLLADGFFAIDLDRIQESVAALPWVAAVEVRKRWPDSVEVVVHEQHAVARWNDTELVNQRGQLFEVPDVAKVTGLPDLGGPGDRLADVVAFYVDCRKRLAAVGREVLGVHLSNRGAWRIRLDDGAELYVGRDRVKRRLARFIATYTRLVAGHPDGFAYVDLRYTNGYAVRWRATTTTAGGSPKA